MAEASVSATVRLPGPGNRTIRRENDDCYIFSLSNISTGTTFTPFGTNATTSVTKGFPKAIYDWALKPVASLASIDAPTSTTTYSSIPVNVGTGAEMMATYTPPTASNSGYFTFTCTAGSGIAQLYVWAK